MANLLKGAAQIFAATMQGKVSALQLQEQMKDQIRQRVMADVNAEWFQKERARQEAEWAANPPRTPEEIANFNRQQALETAAAGFKQGQEFLRPGLEQFTRFGVGQMLQPAATNYPGESPFFPGRPGVPAEALGPAGWAKMAPTEGLAENIPAPSLPPDLAGMTKPIEWPKPAKSPQEQLLAQLPGMPLEQMMTAAVPYAGEYGAKPIFDPQTGLSYLGAPTMPTEADLASQQAAGRLATISEKSANLSLRLQDLRVTLAEDPVIGERMLAALEVENKDIANRLANEEFNIYGDLDVGKRQQLLWERDRIRAAIKATDAEILDARRGRELQASQQDIERARVNLEARRVDLAAAGLNLDVFKGRIQVLGEIGDLVTAENILYAPGLITSGFQALVDANVMTAQEGNKILDKIRGAPLHMAAGLERQQRLRDNQKLIAQGFPAVPVGSVEDIVRELQGGGGPLPRSPQPGAASNRQPRSSTEP